MDLKQVITNFINDYDNNKEDIEEIYNEFSLQHELGFYIRKKYPKYRVLFEKNISEYVSESDLLKFKNVKKEIDLVIENRENPSEKYAIELKYPRNKAYPDQMRKFIKDIKFMGMIKKYATKEHKFNKTYVLTFVDDKGFYEPKSNIQQTMEPYKYFRTTENLWIPKEVVSLDDDFSAKWHYLANRHATNKAKEPIYYYIMTI